MPRLSIVIPVLGNLELLEETLVSVLANRPDDCEILVVLDEPYDDPYDVKDEVWFVDAPEGTDLIASANLGIRLARAPIVHLLACGAEVDEGWTDAACEHFDDPSVAAVAPVIVDVDRPKTLAAAGVAYRWRGKPCVVGRGRSTAKAARLAKRVLGPHSNAAFYSKSAVESVGGFSTDVGNSLAGIDLALSLDQAGYAIAFEPESQVRMARGAVEPVKGFRAAWDNECFFWRWLPAGGGSGTLAAHALSILAESIWSFPRPILLSQWAGRFLGGWSACWYARHRGRIEALRQTTDTPEAAVGRPHFFSDTADLLAPNEVDPRHHARRAG